MKKVRFFYLFLIVLLVASCNKDELTDPTNLSDSDALKSAVPKLKIAVVSDIHYMSPELLPDNPYSNDLQDPYQQYLLQDPKLLTESDAILKQVLSELTLEKPDILLIPGDLTKDGELINHENVAGLLTEFASGGTKIFVIPGNHDILNPEAWDFKNSIEAVSVTPAEFVDLYGFFGYDEAFSKDENSLSYFAEVNEKLWILAIDASKYEENETAGIAIVGGAIKPETMQWIYEEMAVANAKGVQVMAIMHHGILQHFYGQEQIDPGYLVEYWPETAGQLMALGIKVVFTGHYHANDIAQIAVGKNTLSDIQTGSLVTTPCPYRLVTLDENFMKVESKRVTSVPLEFPGGVDFVTYSKLFLSGHLDFYFEYGLQANYGLPEEQAKFVAPFLRNAVMAHYAGDEKIKPDERNKVEALAKITPPESQFLIDAINSFWTDLPINDTQVHIRLK